MRGQKIIRIIDEIPTSAATSLGILIGALVGKTTSTVLTVLLRSLKTSRGPVFFGAASIGPTGRLPLRHSDRPDPIGRTKFKKLRSPIWMTGGFWRSAQDAFGHLRPSHRSIGWHLTASGPFPGEPWAVAGWQDTAPLVFRFVARAYFSLWRRVTLGSRCGRLRCLAAASPRLPVIDGVPTFRRGRRFGTHSDIEYAAECFDR
jgi:hypothetical protein